MIGKVLRPELSLVPKLARIRLVLIDIDGTLVTADRPSFQNVIAHLRGLKQLGIRFSIATGRTIFGVSSITSQLKTVKSRMPPMITYNGAVVLSGEESYLIVRHLIPRSAFEMLIRYCREMDVGVLAYACRMQFDFTPIEVVYTEDAERHQAEFNGMAVQSVPNLLEVDDEFVAVLIDTPDGEHCSAVASELTKALGSTLRVTTSGARFVEICHPLGTKLHGMHELARMLGIETTDIMAVGDNYNDLEMIREAGVGVAVANAPAAVQEAACLRCMRSGAEGVVEALRVLTRSVRSYRPQRSPVFRN